MEHWSNKLEILLETSIFFVIFDNNYCNSHDWIIVQPMIMLILIK